MLDEVQKVPAEKSVYNWVGVLDVVGVHGVYDEVGSFGVVGVHGVAGVQCKLHGL